MNILYDISILGLVHENSIPKTGIARVVETLAVELTQMPECRLELCAAEHLPGALDYIESEPRLKPIGFPHSEAQVSFLRKQISNQKIVDTTTGISHLSARAHRKILHYVAKAGNNSAAMLDSDSLRNADIYHSTYLPLSGQVRDTNGPQLFLTIYDLIPMLFPEYGNAHINALFQTILSSVTSNTYFVSISEATKDDLCQYAKIDPARVFVTPLAADTDLFFPVHDVSELARVWRKYKIKNAPYALSLCTIEPRKNIDHVIRCYVRLMQEAKTPDLQLVLAGAKGWNYDHIFREIDGAEAFKANIVVTGYVANEDLAALYSGAMVFVYPSLYEGFGLPPLEAMQCGTPVITSNTSSLPEVVGDAGIMLDPKDVDGLCGSLLSLYEDAGIRADMAAKSLERAALFSWKRCAEDTVNAYKTAMGR
jgi:glycosyltransferase involved in cell wall biosynthesis